MRFPLLFPALVLSALLVFGCGEEPRKPDEEAGERKPAESMRDEPTLAARNASEAIPEALPPEFVGSFPKSDSPPEFVGPLPREDSPPEFVGPLPQKDSPPEFVGPALPPDGLLDRKAAACPVKPKEPAVDAGKKAGKKPAKKRRTAAKAPAVPKPGPKGPAPETLGQAEEHFRRFAGDWMDSVSNNLLHTARDMQVVEKDGGYLARFVHVEEESLTSAVRASEVASCPWVGTLRYIVAHYENFCSTPECARNGPFDCVKRVRNTEIFRFYRGGWAD